MYSLLFLIIMLGQSNILCITILRKELARTWYFIWFSSSFILQWDDSGYKNSSSSLAKIISWKVLFCCFDFVYLWFWIPLIKFDLVCCVFFLFSLISLNEFPSYLSFWINIFLIKEQLSKEAFILRLVFLKQIEISSKRSWY